MEEAYSSPNKNMKTIIVLSIIIAVGIVVLAKYYVFRLGKAVNAEISNSYFYHSMKSIIVYAPDGNWFELDYVELNADKDSFVPLARDFGKDNKLIFWKGKKQDVEYSTFYIDANGIPKDDNHVYSTIGSWQKQLSVILEANPKTYEQFDTGVDSWNRYWARDGAHYFYQDKKINADYKSFKRINHTIAIDTNSIFAIVNKQVEDSGRVVEMREVIRKSSIISGAIKPINENYVQIGNSVILSNWKNEFAVIPFESIGSIKIIDERNVVVNDQLISDGKLIKGIDITSFVVLQRDFFKDKNNAYYDAEIITSAEAVSFETLSEEYSKDSRHVFYKTKIVENASAQSFKYDYATDLGMDGVKKFKAGRLITTNQ
jgi:DKNYY family